MTRKKKSSVDTSILSRHIHFVLLITEVYKYLKNLPNSYLPSNYKNIFRLNIISHQNIIIYTPKAKWHLLHSTHSWGINVYGIVSDWIYLFRKFGGIFHNKAEDEGKTAVNYLLGYILIQGIENSLYGSYGKINWRVFLLIESIFLTHVWKNDILTLVSRNS